MNRARLTALAVGVVMTACGVEPSAPEPSAVSRSALEQTFDRAAREYQVPVGVLTSIAYLETRVTMPGVSAAGGHGVMQLISRPDWDVLSRAAKLTGNTPARLDVDAEANIRGAAAVLRALFDEAKARDASLDAREPGDWFTALSLYSGATRADDGATAAIDVFHALERGFTVHSALGDLTQPPTASSWARHAPQSSLRRDALADYPGAVGFVQSPNYSAGRSSFEFVVVHTMQGSYSGTKSWFQNAAANASTHYIIRSSDGQITQMVSDDDTAWHVQCYNGRAIGIEHEGYIADPGTWYTDEMYTESAKLTAWLAARHGIPVDRTHIIGHNEVASNCNTNGHTDPGTGWNWTKYMQLVTGGTPTPTNGTLTGLIYEGGSTSNTVAGALVTVNGASVTTGGNGLYQFSVAPGSYTVSVTKAGYGSNSVVRTVTASSTTWGSMEINPVVSTGTLTGTVFAFDAAHPNDMSQPVSGASVTINGTTTTTSASGTYSATLAPGAYTVLVHKSGYVDNQVNTTVVAGQSVTANVGLSTSTTDTQPPQVTFVFPMAGAKLDVGFITVRGNASDDHTTMTSVKLAMNGGSATTVPVTAGAFRIDVQLKPGANTLTVTATDGAGNTGTASTTVTFNAGVSGFIHDQNDPEARIANATVTLLASGSGATVASTTSRSDGAYELPVTNVPADYLLVVRFLGYQTKAQTITVPNDRRLALNVGLVSGSDVPVEQTLTFAEPMDGATVTAETIVVSGSVTGFDVTSVKVNGVTATLMGGGGFSAMVPVNLGPNTIEAIATGIIGQTVSGRITVTRGTASTNPVVIPKLGERLGLASRCSTGVGVWAVLGALVPLLRRRRRS